MTDPHPATPRPDTASEPDDPAVTPFPLISDISAARWLLVFIIAAAIYFFYGFLVPVLAATIIAFASWNLSRSVQRGLEINRTTTAALFILVIVFFLVVPITMALLYAFRELQQWIYWGFAVNANGAPTPLWMQQLPQIGDWIDEQWSRHVGRPGAIAELVQLTSGNTIASIYRSVLAAGNIAFHLALNLLFMLIALFVFYRDGHKIAGQIDIIGARILPVRWERLSRVVPLTISATVTGMALIAMGEGVILGIAYWIAGVPSPVTLGVITGIMALIPGGAPLCFTLVSIYLVASGSALAGVLLFLWGSVELFIVDKTIRPVLVGGPVKMPFLPTFFGLVGGVKTMGIVGLFVGPVLMALLVAIWREWLREIRSHAAKPLKPDPP
ncbi:AI-2E family transporter [Paracoccus sediminis]|uniref:AI-2E family transporter n=1 Tax=Paracoccus sediminis TaxID=1214787 RepID=A0A238VFS4_9RHOB|nr:AI-2E family transporter [Paracoccus sediminis]TBN52026.1 AI-2E family transporter [Paracoccus sediminis]SNR33061.1 Predicted PurR-regulated permease PerM [Paracoccus sediminis]